MIFAQFQPFLTINLVVPMGSDLYTSPAYAQPSGNSHKAGQICNLAVLPSGFPTATLHGIIKTMHGLVRSSWNPVILTHHFLKNLPLNVFGFLDNG